MDGIVIDQQLAKKLLATRGFADLYDAFGRVFTERSDASLD